MISKELLKRVIVSNEDFILNQVEGVVEREGLVLPDKLNKVIIFYGVRRSGKTYVLFDLFKKYKDNSLYIDFEDERLADFGVKDFELLKDAFLELKPSLVNRKLVFLFDEIQNIKGWERFCRRIVERENIRVFVTGSSSRMMPLEIHTSLRGRAWSIEVSPFSFREYLRFKKINVNDKKFIYGAQKAVVKKYFSEYIRWGGFPEVLFLESEFRKKKIIKEYLDAMFFKDLVERFNITNIPLMKTLLETLFSFPGRKFSLTAFYKQYKEKFPLSKDTLFHYYDYFLESMLIFEIKKFSESPYQRLRTPAKTYLVDTGISRKIISDDSGRMLENMVFLELRRKGQKIFYFEGKNECDFIIERDNKKLFPCQVTLELNKDNESREIGGLIESCEKLRMKEGVIFTYDEEEDKKVHGVNVKILPVWKWLIKGDKIV